MNTKLSYVLTALIGVSAGISTRLVLPPATPGGLKRELVLQAITLVVDTDAPTKATGSYYQACGALNEVGLDGGRTLLTNRCWTGYVAAGEADLLVAKVLKDYDGGTTGRYRKEVVNALNAMPNVTVSPQ